MEKFDYAVLGQLIIKQLGFEDENADLTSKWMANYVAQKMKEAESVIGKQKDEAEKECYRAIIELWKYRKAWLEDGNPYKDLKPVMDTIKKLEPENQRYFYWNNNKEPDNIKPEVQQILDIIKCVDKSARVCLEYLIKCALEATVDEEMQKWIKAADNFSNENAEDVFLLRRFIMHDQLNDDASLKKGKLKERIQILEEFQDKSRELMRLYQKELEEEDN
ncbi:MAG: hypothetical protein J6C64_03450 [Lachnospiraceae bacterium]|nr:hypothetical protein [Lachnospiraceae bacterium]